MRTTLTLDADVAAKVKRTIHQRKRPLKEVVNAALRLGLAQMDQPAPARPYVTKARPLGLRAGLSYDNIADVLSRAEAEDFR